MAVQEYTRDEIRKIFEEAWGLSDERFFELPDHERQRVVDGLTGFIVKINDWLRAGQGVCVYENHDLGHWDLGHKRFFSYGTPEAQFEGEPPWNLPDFREINWRYVLIGTYQGEAL